MKTIEIKLPDVGEGITQAELVEWHVKVGDVVREDDVLAAVMTDKATVEIPSICDGKVVWIGGDIGEHMPVGSPLIRIETEADVPAPAPETAIVEEVAPAPPPAAPATPRPHVPHLASPLPDASQVIAAPAVRARAREAGVDLRLLNGSGPGGRITHEDLDNAIATPPPGTGRSSARAPRTDMQEEKIIGLRRKIADRMSLANTRIPHITVVEEVDVTDLEALRTKMNDNRGARPKLTVLPFITSALVRAVGELPQMNAHFDDDAGVVRRYGAVHAGIATMTDKGLVVPVLRHVETLSLWATAEEIARLSEAARDGSAKREELSGSTITITSLGPLGAIVTTPIINHPEVAIVGVNKMAIRPQWDGNGFVPRKMMNLSCSFDHRVIDGYDAALFVNRLKTLLETPALIFVED
ncbi:dihydrolipoamide acetyltransferase family protein [Thioclava sp. A2]|uniref:dihydrolipoamide acetyltransferase family protein n=1 Tax=Thioclava sp. FCG-A2 TaxID=3080562 RepID=UPI0029541B45|nr:dihydrolipoamide acetyltransferase family protein [Thioclava sp. A2]MDV7271026.1 dihydrolipoamide acetyltransferase family protein [Thioclava sp. A2]